MDHILNDAQAMVPLNSGVLGRCIKWVAFAASVALVAVAVSVNDHVRTLKSLRRVPGTNAYVMDYYGNYHIEEIRRGGMDVNNIEDSLIRTLLPDVLIPAATSLKQKFLPHQIRTLKTSGHHCSTVALKSKTGKIFFGRNFDWHHDACLILRVHDADGVASVAVLDLAYLNLNRRELTQTNLIERIPLLFAPYYLMDGMNRHGVAVSGMSVSADPPREPGKPAIIDATLMRLILDYAKDIDDAVALAHDFNVHFVDTEGHLMVADAQGRSCIVECIGGKIQVISSEGPWQVCTNHLAWNRTEQERDARCPRYRIGSRMAEQLGGFAVSDDALRITRSMNQANYTMWTSLYDLTTGEFRVLYKSDPKTEYRGALSRRN